MLRASAETIDSSVSLADQRLHLLEWHGIWVAARAYDLLGLAQHPVVRARLAHLQVCGVSPLVQQLVQVGEVLGLLHPVEHDLPLAIELGDERRRQARADGLGIRWRDRGGVRERGEGSHAEHDSRRHSDNDRASTDVRARMPAGHRRCPRGSGKVTPGGSAGVD
ncbi:MAG: hypothetical protein JO272_07205 [Pseudonocardiales bacterium]|nr:hypothetical protein [Pseudonocardiales bacterium]